MAVEEKLDGEQLVVTVDKSIAASDVEDFKGRFRGHIADGVKYIVLDCAAVEVVDSIGIGFLVAAHNSLKGAGGSLRIVNASDDMFNLLATMRLDKHFSVSRA